MFSIPHSRFRYIVVNSQFFIYISSSLSSRFTIWLEPLVVMWVYISVVLLLLCPLLSQVFQIPGSSFGDSRNLDWKSWQFVTAILSSSSNQFQMETKWHPVFSGLSLSPSRFPFRLDLNFISDSLTVTSWVKIVSVPKVNIIFLSSNYFLHFFARNRY